MTKTFYYKLNVTQIPTRFVEYKNATKNYGGVLLTIFEDQVAATEAYLAANQISFTKEADPWNDAYELLAKELGNA